MINVFSKFVIPQANVLITTHSNLNRQVYKIKFQNHDKISRTLCSETLGACPVKLLRAAVQVLCIVIWFCSHS